MSVFVALHLCKIMVCYSRSIQNESFFLIQCLVDQFTMIETGIWICESAEESLLKIQSGFGTCKLACQTFCIFISVLNNSNRVMF